jgi:hypothetical protein
MIQGALQRYVHRFALLFYGLLLGYARGIYNGEQDAKKTTDSVLLSYVGE